MIECDGYPTCRDCGEVQREGILVPGADWFEYSKDYMVKQCLDEDRYPEMFAAKHADKFVTELDKVGKYELNLASSTVEGAKEFFGDFRQHNLKRGDNMKGIMAASLYYGCKITKTPHPPEVIARAFYISTTKLNKCCTELLEGLVDKPYHAKLLRESACDDLLTKMVYLVDAIVDKWSVIKTARKLISKLEHHNAFRAVKPSKINATIIYIACTILKIDIPKHVFHHSLNVSALTMINHEKLIQGMLRGK